jgi:hypothetical protein
MFEFRISYSFILEMLKTMRKISGDFFEKKISANFFQGSAQSHNTDGSLYGSGSEEDVGTGPEAHTAPDAAGNNDDDGAGRLRLMGSSVGKNKAGGGKAEKRRKKSARKNESDPTKDLNINGKDLNVHVTDDAANAAGKTTTTSSKPPLVPGNRREDMRKEGRKESKKRLVKDDYTLDAGYLLARPNLDREAVEALAQGNVKVAARRASTGGCSATGWVEAQEK